MVINKLKKVFYFHLIKLFLMIISMVHETLRMKKYIASDRLMPEGNITKACHGNVGETCQHVLGVITPVSIEILSVRPDMVD